MAHLDPASGCWAAARAFLEVRERAAAPGISG
jgi:hypothetical protein